MSERLKKFLKSAANNGLGKDIGELSIEHIKCLIEIWNINCDPDTHEHNETNVESAFGDDAMYDVADSCVRDLFEWKYLDWVIKEKTFRVNPVLGDSSLKEMIRRQQELEDKNDEKDTHH